MEQEIVDAGGSALFVTTDVSDKAQQKAITETIPTGKFGKAEEIAAVIMVNIVAVWIIVKGIIRIVAAIRLRQLRKALDAQVLGRNWGKILAMGILMTICGILCLIDSGILMVVIGIAVGIAIISSGVNLIMFVTAKPQ